MKPQERLKHAIEAFEKIALTDWNLLPAESVQQGGQSGVCVVEDTKGNRGVFRCLLPSPTEEEVERFKRELKTLKSISHPNIIKLLHSSEEAPYWYISLLGGNFKTYWDAFTKNNSDDSALICSTALSIIRSIASGLAECHTKSLVHRDIKPNNIVMLASSTGEMFPAIIDFGVRWHPDDERVTDVNGVGNARYAPDVMRNRLEEYAPWVDVFELVQVFMWMVSEMDGKHYWNRPIHWKFLRLPNATPPQFALSLKAAGAATSIEQYSPRDGRELLAFLDSIFVMEAPANDLNVVPNTSAIAEGKARGKAEKILREVTDLEEIEASKQMANIVYQRIRPLFTPLTEIPDVSTITDIALDAAAKDGVVTKSATIFEIACGEGPTKFYIRWNVEIHVASRWPDGGKQEDLKKTNIFCFYIQKYGNLPNGNYKFPHDTLIFTIESDGSLMERREGSLIPIKTISTSNIGTRIQTMISDPEAWKVITTI